MRQTRKPPARVLAELVAMLAVAVGLALAVQAFLVKPYVIPSASMLPTLHISQRILVDRVTDRFGSPHLGQIWVFHPPASETCADSGEGQPDSDLYPSAPCGVAQRIRSAQTYVKRVVGLPGDRLSIRDGHVMRNGRREADGYTVPCREAADCDFTRPITVPRGEYYMMGDNRPDSEDSRFWGPVPRRWMIGQAFATYWPLTRAGVL